MKKQEHLWQNHSPNFLAEKAFNAAVAALEPYCAICSLFHSYTQVIPTRGTTMHVVSAHNSFLAWYKTHVSEQFQRCLTNKVCMNFNFLSQCRIIVLYDFGGS